MEEKVTISSGPQSASGHVAPSTSDSTTFVKNKSDGSSSFKDIFAGMIPGHHNSRMIVIGHRGNGKNRTLLQGEIPDERPSFRENTINSFNTASKFGASFVEFDVQRSCRYSEYGVRFDRFKFLLLKQKCGSFDQVTRDGHPIIFHDDYIILEDKVSRKIGELSLEEFLACGPQKDKSTDGRTLYRKAKDNYVSIWTATVEDSLCTLQEVFEEVDQNVGFNVEVKFDDVLKTSDDELRRVLYPILEVVKQHAKGRKVYYSSFNPDAVYLLRKEQSSYPVFFLTDGGVNLFNDPRRNSIQAAVQVCEEGNLQGIVTEVGAILREPTLVSLVKQVGLWLFSYGVLNNIAEVVEKQKILGVDGVIVDHVLEVVTVVRDLEKLPLEKMLNFVPTPLRTLSEEKLP
ncbi:glycerophosphodiester phosphodiesterase GDPD1, chloroplastic isoform X1 [Physcomitrium patens]|uniref:glycerophosphodiester phosphodiesterase GDPD1, chloroplastic isoform X1 n=1 Tax=Physcomitrium patens TaxID=3218 RepID=UPI003CCD96D7